MMANEFIQIAESTGAGATFGEINFLNNPRLWPVIHSFYMNDKMDRIIGHGRDTKRRFLSWALDNVERIYKIANRLDRERRQAIQKERHEARTAEWNARTQVSIHKEELDAAIKVRERMERDVWSIEADIRILKQKLQAAQENAQEARMGEHNSNRSYQDKVTAHRKAQERLVAAEQERP